MEIDELLESWDASQDTIQVFRDNNIDVSCLDGLEEELKFFIPPSRLRDQIKYKMGYNQYREDFEAVHSETYYVASRTETAEP